MKNKRGRRPKSESFKPGRRFIKDAVEDFLKKGGKITRIEPTWTDFDPASLPGDPNDVDEFLAGN